MAAEMSAEDKEFLAKCEEELKDRYTDKDEEFMKVFNAEPSVPPIVESWWVPNNSGRRDRRNNRRHHPYERSGYRGREGGHQDRRGYSDYREHDDRSGHRYSRPRHY